MPKERENDLIQFTAFQPDIILYSMSGDRGKSGYFFLQKVDEGWMLQNGCDEKKKLWGLNDRSVAKEFLLIISFVFCF